MSLLLLLKAAPGHADPDALGIIGVLWLIILGCWAIGYRWGLSRKAPLIGAALGSLIIPACGALFMREFSFLIVGLLIAIQIWGWCGIGYAVGKQFSHAVIGGWLGGAFSVIDLVLWVIGFLHHL